MTSPAGRRGDQRGEATRTALIEAAERLFAERGVDAVSVRDIGAAIGSANTNVVAYHFGSKQELIRAIYRHRLPEIDRRRGALLDAADREGASGDAQVLVRAFFQPLFEQVDANGRRSYARFIAGMDRAGLIATRGAVADEFPQTSRLEKRIAALLPALSAELLYTRLRLIAGLFAVALGQIDQDAADDAARAAAHFDNAVAMGAHALAAPVPQICRI